MGTMMMQWCTHLSTVCITPPLFDNLSCCCLDIQPRLSWLAVADEVWDNVFQQWTDSCRGRACNYKQLSQLQLYTPIPSIGPAEPGSPYTYVLPSESTTNIKSNQSNHNEGFISHVGGRPGHIRVRKWRMPATRCARTKCSTRTTCQQSGMPERQYH